VPSSEELHRVVVLDVLREDDHAGARKVGADPLRGVDALGREGRRHPDVGEHRIGPVQRDGAVERVRIGHCLDELDLSDLAEQPGDPLSDEVVVVREHDPHRHGPHCRWWRHGGLASADARCGFPPRSGGQPHSVGPGCFLAFPA
jgi:hypothetical protein